MEGRRERCSRCGGILLVTYDAKSKHCSVCQAVTPVRSSDPFGQIHQAFRQTAGRLKKFFNSVSSDINPTVAQANNNYPAPNTSGHGYYFQTNRPPPQVSPVSAYGKKRAVLCGVSYYGKRYRLNGSVNDVRCMKFLLIERFGFPNESVVVLTEEERDPFRIPTKNNVLMALQWLVRGNQSGDSLVFYYSGHGSQQPDFDGDEIDGHDETLLPVDHELAGQLSDDEINAIIVRPLLPGAKVHAIIDACHSGTALDLPFLCKMNREGYYKWEDHSSVSSSYKGTSGGLAITVSACADDQLSVDTTAFSGNVSTGALTFCFIQAVENEPGLTYGRLLNVIRTKIRDTQTGGLPNGPLSSLARLMLSRPHLNKPQKPQLSSSEKFDVYSKPFTL